MVDTEYWKGKTLKITGTPFSLIGFSWAARKTSFYIPELRLMLDCGVPNGFSPEHIFITHGHADHSFNLPWTIIDTGTVKPKIYVHTKKKDDFYQYINSAYILSTSNPTPKIHKKYELISCDPDTNFLITVSNKKWKVDVIRCIHTVPCIGYGFTEMRHKLKKEFIGLEQKELIELKKNGIELTEEIEYPLFCYLGDTNDSILKNPILNKYKFIMIECTFLDPEDIVEAIKDRHMHWSLLEHYILSNPETTFVLYHFSMRYKTDYIRTFFENKNVTNVIPWIKNELKNEPKNELKNELKNEPKNELKNDIVIEEM